MARYSLFVLNVSLNTNQPNPDGNRQTYRRNEREPVALGDAHSRFFAEVVNQVNMPLVRHDVFAGGAEDRRL